MSAPAVTPADRAVAPLAPLTSRSIVCKPRDGRCRYWAKVVRAEDALPLPGAVHGANDIPGSYVRPGDDIEIFAGDYLLEGEAVHHVKQRGWDYTLRTLARGAVPFDADTIKPPLRSFGRKDLLTGSGDCAAMIRAIHLARMMAAPTEPPAPAAVDGNTP